VEAAASGDHAPERLAAVMRAWRETAEILGSPEAMAELAESADAIRRGDVIRGRDAVRALRARP
jgi:PHD/YefM family antitoxin component YafN of YafNO toxin-antitoxin module